VQRRNANTNSNSNSDINSNSNSDPDAKATSNTETPPNSATPPKPWSIAVIRRSVRDLHSIAFLAGHAMPNSSQGRFENLKI
jgi:hypothetical protein